MRADRRALVVIDTNVWISAALQPQGVPGQVVRWVLAHALPVFSEATFDELRSRLWKPKFDRWLSIEQRKLLLHDADALALRVVPAAGVTAQTFSRDRDDDAFIHAALAAGAHGLVSGDQDLLALAGSLPFPILSPIDALRHPLLAAAGR